MGRPKARLPWFGRSMLEHVLDRLRPVVDELIVVASAELELPPLDARIVRDREPDRGPLEGIREGLAAAHSDLAFVTSTDAPFLTPEHVNSLLERGRAVAPLAEGRVQVLSAVYPCTAWKEAAALLERGVARPLALLEGLGYEPLESPLDEATPPWRGFNTPSEYLACARSVDPSARAELELLGRAALASERRLSSWPIGTLSELLAQAPTRLSLVQEGRVASAFLASLGGRELVRDGAVPVGPGERVSVIDAQAGG
jgi:molybdopterin-guanine dinucleotide biosynthesis protein A